MHGDGVGEVRAAFTTCFCPFLGCWLIFLITPWSFARVARWTMGSKWRTGSCGRETST